jgi:hypothetical protein
MHSGDHESSRDVNGETWIWKVERLWRLSRRLRVREVRIENIPAFYENNWFFGGGEEPTCIEVAEHCRRILEADLSYPILLADDGSVFDGLHRISKAYLEGRETILAKRFRKNPSPDNKVKSPVLYIG